jgi:adenylyl-sulfate kinase
MTDATAGGTSRFPQTPSTGPLRGQAAPPPTSHIYAHEHPESDRRRDGGFTLWFTGLSGSGKTTIAHLVGPELDRRGHVVEYLDGDTVRTHLSKGLGFSKEDRDTNIERIGWVASRLTRQGGAVIAAAISPYEETRRYARALVEEWGTFVEVFVKASVDECARRDVKGLYEKAFRGEIKGFTGVDDPYEEPSAPELVVDTEELEPEQAARAIVAKLEELRLVRAEVAA